MREPAFWSKRNDWRAILLSPLGVLYAAATARRLSRGTPVRLDVPVVCVGNINAGGTGKTPTVIALVERLRDMGHRPAVVSRGYGGKLEGPVEVDPARHRSEDVGDEPLLISAFSDVWVAKDRAQGGRAAQASGATVIILDDGFQNPSLEQDLKVVVVDAVRGFGNGRCIPAGPLREPVNVGLTRADAVITLGTHIAQNAFSEVLPEGLPRITGEVRPLQTGMDWSGGTYLAFAGIAHPEKFFATLRAEGANLVQTVALSDHEPLTASLIARLARDAATLGVELVTTEKDAARLPTSWRGKVLTLPVRLQFNDGEALNTLLQKVPAP